MKRKIVLLPTAVFLCFVFVFATLFIVTPKQSYSSSEKRYLEDFPEAGLESITDGGFESGFETYLADHFPLRNLWVGLNAYYSLAVGNNGSDGVYNCADGYLINKPVSSDNRVKTNTDTLISLKNSIDVPMTVMLAPSTGYVMNKKLPAVHEEYIDDYIFGDIKPALKKAGIDFVDLRESFKKSKKQLYYKTDHHWTSEGAYLAYEKLCAQLKKPSAVRDMYKIETYQDFYGTTYSTSGFWLNKPDEISIWRNISRPEGSVKLKITEGKESKTYDSLFFTKHLEEDDKYPVFIDGNHALETIVNKNVKKGSALVIKDSFCHSLAPFLADSYRKVTLVDMRYYKNSVSEMVKSGKYDNVLVVYGIDNFATDTDLVWLK